MKVANLYGPLDLRMEEKPVPVPMRNQVLVKIKASGICGSDVNCYTGRTYEGTFPYIPGHEWSGEVQQIGDDVTTLKKRDRVTGETVIGCGICGKCKTGVNPNFCMDPIIYGFQTKSPGAFAEYGADLALEASGSDDARSRLFDVVDGSSRVVMIGQIMMKKIPVEMEKMVVKGLTVKGAAGSPGMFPRTIEFFERNRTDLTSMISHRFPLADVKEAMDLASKRTESVKVILTD